MNSVSHSWQQHKNVDPLLSDMKNEKLGSCLKQTQKHILITVTFDEEKASRCHGSKIYGSQQTVVLQIWQEKTMHSEQNGSRCFPLIVLQCKCPSLSRKIVEIQKSCYHTSLYF